jgi:hypothetical protein
VSATEETKQKVRPLKKVRGVGGGTFPNCFSTAFWFSMTVSKFEMSTDFPMAVGLPASSHSRATSAAPSPLMSQITTEQPSFASRRLISRPIPEAPPVTSATCPATRLCARG